MGGASTAPRPAENRKRQRNEHAALVGGSRGEDRLPGEAGPSSHSSSVFERVRSPPQASGYPFARTPPASQDWARLSEMTRGARGTLPRVTPVLGWACPSPLTGRCKPPPRPLSCRHPEPTRAGAQQTPVGKMNGVGTGPEDRGRKQPFRGISEEPGTTRGADRSQARGPSPTFTSS